MLATILAAAISLADFSETTAGHYQVFTQSGPEMGRQVNSYMNAMLQLYCRYFSNWQAKAGARVVVFNSLDDFRQYSRDSVGMTHPGLAGYCHLKTDEDGNTFFELVTYESAGLWGVLAHEGFHQFIGYELGRQVPVWLNEGMAQYFENSAFQNGRLVPGQIDGSKLAAAQTLIRTRRLPAASELFAMDRQTFYANADMTYPASWALVQYLMTQRTSSFRRYLADLKWNRPTGRFGRDTAAWQADFERFVLQLKAPAEN